MYLHEIYYKNLWDAAKAVFKGTATGTMHILRKKKGWKSMRCSSYKMKDKPTTETVEGK